MPTRLLREGILTSERVDALDPPAEVFYRRLMSKVDDHGLYDARPSILRASLYPLRVDRVREADISRWIAACEKAGLIALYSFDGKPFLKVLDTRWQVRTEPKYPLPPGNICKQVLAPVHVDVDVVEDVGKALSGTPDPVNGFRDHAKRILDFLNEKTGRHYEPVPPNLDPIMARLREGSTPADVAAVIERKCADWLFDEKMNIYLRPATLFNRTKFAQYKGELGSVAPAAPRKVALG